MTLPVNVGPSALAGVAGEAERAIAAGDAAEMKRLDDKCQTIRRMADNVRQSPYASAAQKELAEKLMVDAAQMSLTIKFAFGEIDVHPGGQRESHVTKSNMAPVTERVADTRLRKLVKTLGPEGKTLAAERIVEKVESDVTAMRAVKRMIEDRERAESRIEFDGEFSVEWIHSDIESLPQHVEAGSVDAIITDPPYPKQYLHLWPHLAKLAVSVLRPGGVCGAIIPNGYMPEVLASMTVDGLAWRGEASLLMTGANAFDWATRMNAGHKPFGLWVREPTDPDDWQRFTSTIKLPHATAQLTGTEFGEHPSWGQNADGFVSILEKLDIRGTVLEPYAGGGTTLLACATRGLHMIAADKSAEMIALSKERLSG